MIVCWMSRVLGRKLIIRTSAGYEVLITLHRHRRLVVRMMRGPPGIIRDQNELERARMIEKLVVDSRKKYSPYVE